MSAPDRDAPTLRRYHLSGDVTTAPSLVPELPLPFVGREGAIHLLQRRLLAGPRLVFLTGAGGIGKSATAVAVARQMSQVGYFSDGVIWLEGRESLSYGGLLDELARQLGQGAAQGRHLPHRERHLLQQVADHDYLLVVDGLDGLIEGRRQAVQFLRRLPGAILVTSRLHPPGLEQPERLDPLPQDAGLALLQALMHEPLSLEEGALLLRQCQGLPLALRLVAARLCDDIAPTLLADEMIYAPTGQLQLGSFRGQTTGVLRAYIVAARGLSAADAQLVLAASSLRRTFVPALLAHVVEQSEDEVVHGLERLAARGLIERTVRGWRVHDSLVEALQQQANPLAERQDWHQRIAERLSQAELDDLPLAAEHLRRAGDSVRAAELLVEQAERLLDAGLEGPLSEQLAPNSPSHMSPALWLRVSEVLGDVAVRRGQWWEARHFFQRALLQLPDKQPDDEQRLLAVRLARKQAMVAIAESDQQSRPALLHNAERWLDRALRAASSATSSELVAVALLRSQLFQQRKQGTQALEAARHALSLARRGTDAPLLRRSYEQVGALSHQLGEPGAALAAYESARLLAAQHGSPEQQASLLQALADIHCQQGNWIEAAELLGESLPLWRQVSLGERLGEALHQVGRLLAIQGELGRGQRFLQEGQIVARRAALPELAARLRAAQAEIVLRQGDPEVARAMLEEAISEARQTMVMAPLAALYRLLALAVAPDDEEAAQQLREAAYIWARRGEDLECFQQLRLDEALHRRDPAAMEALLPSLAPTLPFEQARLRLALAEVLWPSDAARARVLLVEAGERFAQMGARQELEQVARVRQQERASRH